MKHVLCYGYNQKFQFQAKLPHGPVRVECAGFTATPYSTVVRGQGQYAQETQLSNIEPNADTLHSRFPNAERFSTESAAALECDFWKLVLSSVFGVRVPKFSHGSIPQFLDAARAAGLDVNTRLNDRTLWGEELKHFVSTHMNSLSACREQSASEAGLALTLQSSPNPTLREWARKRLDAEARRVALAGWDVDRKVRRMQVLLHYEKMMTASCRELSNLFKTDSPALVSFSHFAQELLSRIPDSFKNAHDLLSSLEELRDRAQTECQKLDAERPTIDSKV